MKKIITFIVLCVFAGDSIAQKPKNDKPPTTAEMKKMMAEAQKQLDNLDPKTKKVMDSMGIKMPKFDEKVFDKNAKQIEKIMAQAGRNVPKKDVARIAGIAKEQLTKTNINSYLQKIHIEVLKKLPTVKKENTEKLLSKIKENEWYGTAIGLWMNGNNELALYILGKAVIKNSENADAINNYAAYLSMAGGEQWAIPILNMLNKDYPYNSTVLNNLGQAWFGLGEIELATKHLNSCIAIAPNHSQANATMCLVFEEKGKDNLAIDAMKKSIKESYSKEKADKLKKLGHKIRIEDINWNYTKRDDNLGLANFTFPDYHLNYIEQKEKLNIMADFNLTVGEKINELRKSVTVYEVNAPVKQNRTLPPLFHKAFLLKELSSDNNHEVYRTAMKELHKVEAESRKQFEEVLEVIRNANVIEYDDGRQTGCAPVIAALTNWFANNNPPLREAQDRCLKAYKNIINDDVYYDMFLAATDEEFENAKTLEKMNWLQELVTVHEPVGFYSYCKASGNANEPDNKNVPKEKKHKLAYFDDLNCPNPVSVNTPIGSYTIDCHKSSLELKPSIKVLGLSENLGFEYKYEGDSYRGTSTHELGLSYGEKYGNWNKDIKATASMSKGPFSAEVEAKAEINAIAFVEFNNKGLSDMGIKAKANAGISREVNADTKLDIGKTGVIDFGNISGLDANIRIGVNSGVSGEIKSILGNKTF
jgi:tetratricopeptide (TPR) repeat protein